MEDLLFVDEAAKLMRVTRKTLYDWMREGTLDYVMVGGRRRISRAALQKLIRPGGTTGDDVEGVQSENKLAPVPVAA